ncbi:hypothetical protein STVIR_0935 [Streptomyces viridochromogenes Tue57]|uniref:Uncharacterized protein n=1 Tax=Streptomyces viridochromogenes Tue57 TaxID=1160705 RepID=L8PKN3_STRVR|nr:hypothetical protein STVIR_0935 [Streptomyces viridochromogenes Tue57]
MSESHGIETAWMDLGGGALRARGRAVGTRPEPYWIAYELDTADAFVNGERLPDMEGAVDCDLGLCPLTSTMPVLRHRLHQVPATHEFLMAWGLRRGLPGAGDATRPVRGARC